MRSTRVLAAVSAFAFLSVAACSSGAAHPASQASKASQAGQPSQSGAPSQGGANGLNIYAAAGANMLSAAVSGQRSLVYVPNHSDGTISVIDPATFTVIDTFRSGPGTQHVVPSWDLKTLYANNDEGGDSLTPINPVTGKRAGPNIPVADPYNMYFTPDGSYAIVVAEAQRRLDFRDPHTFARRFSIHVDCSGVNHIDFAADLKSMIATCEFSGKLVRIDLTTRTVTGYLTVGGMPQDIKIDPTGEVYYVADMNAAGVHEISAKTFTEIGFLPTGPEAHGLYPSRDAKFLYVANRGGSRNAGSVSVINFATRQVVANWPIPGGGTPDMGNVSADGKQFWLSGRRSNVVYVFDTTTGALLARIKVGHEPHGLCVWPQPGNYSLGHTGIMR